MLPWAKSQEVVKTVFLIRIRFNEDPDPAVYLNADPDPNPEPGIKTNADPDPGQTLQ